MALQPGGIDPVQGSQLRQGVHHVANQLDDLEEAQAEAEGSSLVLTGCPPGVTNILPSRYELLSFPSSLSLQEP
jgi:hypothetical protein